jgi:hypothetical protein
VVLVLLPFLLDKTMDKEYKRNYTNFFLQVSPSSIKAAIYELLIKDQQGSQH